jgi:cytoskeleton protein RodZ
VSDTLDVTTEDQRSASQLLSEARVAMGLSQEQVAQELYLSPSYIQHIDNDEIEKIDKQAFVRGYLRSYAKLVNLDGDDMVARFDKTTKAPLQEIEIRGVTQEPVGSTNFTGPVIQTAVMGLIGLVVVVSLVWLLVSSGKDEEVIVATTPERSAPPQVVSEPATTEDLTTDTQPVDETDLDPAPEFLVSEPEQAPEQTLEEAAESVASDLTETVEEAAEEIATQLPGEVSEDFLAGEAELEEAVETVSEDLIVAEDFSSKDISIERVDGVIRVSAGGNDELSFSFSDECWVEIEDGEGHAIYGDLNRPGDQLVVTGVGPFEVLFGKAPAVTMSFNGEPFDLRPHTTSVDTAKVKVGN